MKPFEKKGWYRVSIPDDWEADEEEGEEPAAVYRPEGAGALQITAQAPRPLPPGGKIDVFLMLRAFLKQTGVDFDDTEAKRYAAGGLDWASCEYTADSPEDGELLWRSWMATNHDLVVFLTYCCRADDRDRERADVDAVVASLQVS